MQAPTAAEAARLVLAPAQAAAAAEAPAVERVAERLADVVAGGGRVYALGAGHAQAFAMELCARAGGLRAFVAMSLEDLRPERRDAWRQLADSAPEREPANGPALLDHHRVGAADAVLIASNSGRNGAIVEAALECGRRGTYAAAFTSLAHSRAVPSRHPSGRRLCEVVPDVVDNHCPHGDATLEVPGLGRACAASTVSFALLAQMLNAALIGALLRRGHRPDVLVSANVDRP